MSQLKAWAPFFSADDRMRGRSMQMTGKAERVNPQPEELLRVNVDDDGTAEVSLKAEDRHVSAECTCDAFAEGAFCPHLWATLVLLERSDDDEDIDLWNELVALTPRPPRARKRADNGNHIVQTREPDWVGRMSLLRPPMDEAPDGSVFTEQRQVVYIVMPEPSTRHNGLVVEVRQRTPTMTGWSRSRPLKISRDLLPSLDDPTDRELCGLLLGAVWVTHHEAGDATEISRSHAMYRVPRGAQRRVVRDMIRTGRAFIEHDPELEPVALTWDRGRDLQNVQSTKPVPAWTPWLVGEEVEGDLLLTMQLRRQGKRLPITEPLLVLGGADGIIVHQGKVAPLDDHDAWRWISQFRDRRYRDDADEDASTMKVDAADVGRFLKRLYMLPQLPEIDLPDAVGHSEQRVVPVPQLELFGPGSAEAAQLAATTAKSHLLGRLTFLYGEQAVNPSQTGRFVSIAAAPAPENPDTDEDIDEQDPEDHDPQESPTVDALDDTSASDRPEIADDDGETQTETQIEIEAEIEIEEQAEISTAIDPDPDPESAPEVDPQPDENDRLIRRDLHGERNAIALTMSLGMRPAGGVETNTLLVPTKQVPGIAGELMARGWKVLADQRSVRAAGPPSVSITSGIDWFELRGNVSFEREDGTQIDIALPEVLAAARAGRDMIDLGDGTQGLLPQQWLADHGLLTALGEDHQDHLRFKTSQAAMLDTLLGENELFEFDHAFAQARRRLHAFDGIEAMDPAQDFKGTLRSYQREGLGWFGFLRWFGMGGILADDMGLGKTVQVLAMLQARKLGLPGYTVESPSLFDADKTPETHAADADGIIDDEPTVAPASTHRPSIIVVPRSVIFNWIDEAEHFTPELRVCAYTGPEREDYRENFEQYDLIVTSYGLMRRDIDALAKQEFDYAVIDEAQAIKNPQSQSSKAARLLKARHRLALTGTPIENHLGDLWSIFEFLNPGMLGSATRFGELIRGAGAAPAVTLEEIDPEDDAPVATPRRDALHQAAAVLRPFILRRTKKQVLDDLPEKTEQTIICEMEPAQRRVYDQLREYYRQNLRKQLDSAPGAANGTGKGLGRAAFMVLEALLRLRQAACHPALIDKQNLAGLGVDTQGAPSAKLDELDLRLDEIIAEGSKSLVFSQFTSMLGLVRQRLDAKGIRYAYLDGQTRNRKQIVRQFQEDPELQVFLISLKAGGVGLNLTAAEYVFILDPWWNPAVEAQAIDRTHRIGQTRPVFAYRLICEDTVEQRILELQRRKRDLADAMVGGDDDVLRNLSRDDLEKLLS